MTRRAFIALPTLLIVIVLSKSANATEPTISAADYLHGQSQLRQILSDRPAMETLLTEADPLRIWAAAQLAGALAGFPIRWDPKPPPDGIEAQHYLQPTPAVRVHPIHQTGRYVGEAKTSLDLWADLVFELHNIAQADEFTAIWEQVLIGKADYAAFIDGITRAEHRALVQTATFYRTHWRHWLSQRGIEPLSDRWCQIQAVPLDYQQWISRYRDPTGYPHADYRQAYNQVAIKLRALNRGGQANPFYLPNAPLVDAGEP